MTIDNQLQTLIAGFLEISSGAERILSRVEASFKGTNTLATNPSEEKEIFLTNLRSFEKEIFGFLLHYQPVARDLRIVSSMIKTLADIERIGAQGCDIRALMKKDGLSTQSFKDDGLLKMISDVRKMVSTSIDAFVQDKKEKAQEVIDSDDVVDQAFFTLKESISQKMASGKSSRKDIDKIMIAKYLERIADHACSIAWRVFSL